VTGTSVVGGQRVVRARPGETDTLLAVTTGIAVVSLLAHRDAWDDDVSSTVLVPVRCSRTRV